MIECRVTWRDEMAGWFRASSIVGYVNRWIDIERTPSTPTREGFT